MKARDLAWGSILLAISGCYVGTADSDLTTEGDGGAGVAPLGQSGSRGGASGSSTGSTSGSASPASGQTGMTGSQAQSGNENGSSGATTGFSGSATGSSGDATGLTGSTSGASGSSTGDSGGVSGASGAFGGTGASGASGSFGMSGMAHDGGMSGMTGSSTTGSQSGGDAGSAIICSSGKTWNGKTGATMRPGESCTGCHSFTVAGTVFLTAHEKDDCNGVNVTGANVVITDAKGAVTTIPVNNVGNFYSSANVVKPFHAKLSYSGRERAMTATQTLGSCNSCHSDTGQNGAPGRLMLP